MKIDYEEMRRQVKHWLKLGLVKRLPPEIVPGTKTVGVGHGLYEEVPGVDTSALTLEETEEDDNG